MGKCLEEEVGYCTSCEEERAFKRVDEGIALISLYQCSECGKYASGLYFQRDKE